MAVSHRLWGGAPPDIAFHAIPHKRENSICKSSNFVLLCVFLISFFFARLVTQKDVLKH